MGDLYLHLGFARRARFAEGLHPLVVEALARSPGALILGATLPYLPEVEHKGASFFRRLFMPGKQKRAFWRKALEPAGSPSLELALGVMTKGQGPYPGSMARFALGLGVLSHQVLHANVADVTAELEGGAREAMNRALARVWLDQAFSSTDVLAAALKPALHLEEANAHKALVEHLNAALREAHGEAPGTETLWRWVRGLCADVDPLVSRPQLPPSLSTSDEEAREKHGAALQSSAASARAWFVFLANRLAPLFLAGDPSREQMRAALVDEGDALRRPNAEEETPAAGGSAAASAFRDAVVALRNEHLGRGRNPKPAYDEVSGAEHAAPPAGMPPLPDDASGAMPRVPAHTQEVSVADIEAELRPPPDFGAPLHTQEVSVAQIEEQLAQASAPAAPTSTQQVSLDDIQEELAAQAPSSSSSAPAAPTSTQQVSLDDIQEELAAQAPSPASTLPAGAPPAGAPPAGAPPAAAPKATQQVSLDDIQEELALLQAPAVPAPRDPSAPFLAGAVPVPPPPSAPVAAAAPAAPATTTPAASAPAPTSSPTASATAAVDGGATSNGAALPEATAPTVGGSASDGAEPDGKTTREGPDPAGA